MVKLPKTAKSQLLKTSGDLKSRCSLSPVSRNISQKMSATSESFALLEYSSVSLWG